MILIIDKRDTLLSYQSGCIKIKQGNEKARTAAISQLEQVIVIGNPTAETAVWRALAHHNVPTVMLSARGELQTAMLGSGLAVQLPLRRLQHQCANQPKNALAAGRWFADLKLQSYELPLQALSEHCALTAAKSAGFARQANESRAKIKKADSVAALMGQEGQLARTWFTLLAESLPRQWKFTGRNRRPPQDPVNALLSLGYTLLLGDVRQMLMASGLDPSLGFLHQDAPGRDSLALDFCEIFRSGVDFFVLRCIHEYGILADDFYYHDAEGCRLAKEARPKFFQAWAIHREHWPRPFINEDEAGLSLQELPVCHIHEQVNGQIANFRRFLGGFVEVDSLPSVGETDHE